MGADEQGNQCLSVASCSKSFSGPLSRVAPLRLPETHWDESSRKTSESLQKGRQACNRLTLKDTTVILGQEIPTSACAFSHVQMQLPLMQTFPMHRIESLIQRAHADPTSFNSVNKDSSISALTGPEYLVAGRYEASRAYLNPNP